jgi:hypothetical protein
MLVSVSWMLVMTLSRLRCKCKVLRKALLLRKIMGLSPDGVSKLLVKKDLGIGADACGVLWLMAKLGRYRVTASLVCVHATVLI